MSVSEALGTGLQTTVTGLAIVFSVLIIIMLVLQCFNVIFGEKKKKPEAVNTAPAAEEVKAEPVAQKVDEKELIAVLTAAVAASLNTSTYNLQIKSYRRVDKNAPSWNKAGIRDTINSRF